MHAGMCKIMPKIRRFLDYAIMPTFLKKYWCPGSVDYARLGAFWLHSLPPGSTALWAWILMKSPNLDTGTSEAQICCRLTFGRNKLYKCELCPLSTSLFGSTVIIGMLIMRNYLKCRCSHQVILERIPRSEVAKKSSSTMD